MGSSNLLSIKAWDGYRRRESAGIPHSHERGERSAQAIPSARNDNGRDRPLSLLCLLPLPALLRHVTSGRRRDYFRSHTPPRSGGFPYGGASSRLSQRGPARSSRSDIERASLQSGPRGTSVPLLDKEFTGRPSFGVGHVHSSPYPFLFEVSPHFVLVVHPNMVSCCFVARKGTPRAEGARRRHFLGNPRPQMASPGRVACGPWGNPRRTRALLAVASSSAGPQRQKASPRGRSGLPRRFLTVRVATSPRVERVADRLLEFLVALTGRKVLGGGLGTSANGASGNGLDAPGDRLRMERVTDRGRDNRGHRRALSPRIVTRTEPSTVPTATASDSNRPNWVAQSFGITVLPAS